MTTQSQERETLRELRRAINEIRLSIDCALLCDDRARNVAQFIEHKLDYLRHDPEAYHADQIGELSTLAQVLMIAIYQGESTHER